MASKSAILSVRIVSESKDFGKGFKDAESRVGKFEASTKKLGSSMRELEAPAMVTTAAIGAAMLKAGDLAATAEQNVGAVQTVFGDAATSVLKWADDSADAVGMSTSSYNELASSIGGSLRSAVKDQDELASKTNELINASADLSSVFGGTAPEAAAAMGAALRGEFDSLERFGVFLNMAAVEAELARTGQDKLSGAALDAAKKQAIQNLIMEQAAQYQGNFAREADTTAGAQQRAAAAFENAATELGENLLPYLTMAAEILSEFATWISENTQLVMIIAGVIGGFAVAILAVNGAIRAYQTITTIATAAQAAWNMAMSANPIALLVIAIAALVAGIIWAYNNVEWFRNGVDAAFAFIRTVIDNVTAFFTYAWLQATLWVQRKIQAWQIAFQIILQAARQIINNVVEFFRNVWDGAVGHIKGVIESFGRIVDGIFNGIRNVISNVVGFFRRSWDGAVGHVKGILDGLGGAVQNVGRFLGLTGGTTTIEGYVRPAIDVPTDGRPFMMTAAGYSSTAPSWFAGPSTSSPALANINVTINAGVGDPVEIGRQVDRVLTRYRRTVGVTAGV